MRDVGRYYVHHLHVTAGAPELLRRALERGLAELEQGDAERFARRMSRLRRSLQLDTRHGAVAAALLGCFLSAARAARMGDAEGAKACLQPALEATLASRPRTSVS